MSSRSLGRGYQQRRPVAGRNRTRLMLFPFNYYLYCTQVSTRVGTAVKVGSHFWSIDSIFLLDSFRRVLGRAEHCPHRIYPRRPIVPSHVTKGDSKTFFVVCLQVLRNFLEPLVIILSSSDCRTLQVHHNLPFFPAQLCTILSPRQAFRHGRGGRGVLNFSKVGV